MVKRVALGIEISEDRAHTSIVAAGYVNTGIVPVDLLAYLTGTDATSTVLRFAQDTDGAVGCDRPALARRDADQTVDRCGGHRDVAVDERLRGRPRHLP
jgi:hypothetical protein